MSIRRIATALRALAYVATALLVTAALTLLAFREVIEHPEQWRPSLEQWLSERAGHPVSIGALSGEWVGMSPELHAREVRIEPLAASPVTIDRLSFRVFLRRSLMAAGVRARLRVEGVTLRVGPPDSGGIGATAQARLAPGWLALLASEPRVTVHDVRVIVDGVYERRTDVLIRHAKLWPADGRLWGRAQLALVGPDAMDIETRMALDLSALSTGKVDGRVYAEAVHARLAAWIPPAMRQQWPIVAEGGRGDSALWIRWRDSRLVSIVLGADWHDITLAGRDAAPVSISDATATLGWVRTEAGWRTTARDVSLTGEGFSWRPATLVLDQRAMAGASDYRFHMSNAVFKGHFNALLKALSVDVLPRQWLLEARPTGRVRDLDIRWRRTGEHWQFLGGRMDVSDMAFRPSGKLPGMRGLGATAWMEGDTVWVDLNERDLELDYPTLFRQPLAIKNLQGQLGIRWTSKAIAIRSSPISLTTPHGSAATRLALLLPRHAPENPGHIALQATLRQLDATEVHRYLPAGIMTEKLLAWLDMALRGGRLVQGDIVINGPLRQTVSSPPRSVLLGFQVEDGVLQFLPTWEQPVTGLDADVIVENGIVSATARGGDFLGMALHDIHVSTRRQPDAPHLQVSLTGQGNAKAGLRILRETPLGTALRDPLAGMEVKGDLDVNFSLDTALISGATPTGSVGIRLAGGRLDWAMHRLRVDNIDADVRYDFQKGLMTERFTGETFGHPVEASLYSTQERAHRVTRLDVKGRVEARALATWLDTPWLDALNGEAPYALRFYFRPLSANTPSELYIDSTLKGMGVDLPHPFGKSESEHRPLTIRRTLARRYAVHSARYDDLMSVTWETDQGAVTRAGLSLGAAAARLPVGDRWIVSGALERFRWDEWRHCIPQDTASAASREWMARLAGSNLLIGDFRPGETALGALRLEVSETSDAVVLAVRGQRLQGHARIPRALLPQPDWREASLPLTVHIERMVLPPRTMPGADTPAPPVLPEPPATFDPRRLPPVDLSIERLMLGDEAFGRYAMSMVPTPRGVTLKALQFDLKHIHFEGQGRWERSLTGSETALSGHGNIQDVAKVMQGFGYAASMTSENTEIDADLTWRGAPWQFNVARTDGVITAHAKKGKFMKVDNSAARRVFGLLNFETWFSRLQLEFDDVSANEMTYTSVKGRYRLASNAVKVERMKIDSPSIRVKMEGDLDLAHRRLVMQWHVTIPVTRNLMLPAVVVGGLPYAATAFVIDRVLGKQIDRLTTLTYDVTGPFDAPVTRVRTPL